MFEKVLQLFKKPGDIPQNGSVPAEILKEYYQSRSISHKEHICHAPFNNMYFNTEGHVANCWLTFYEAEVYDGKRSINDIWNGEKFTKLRRQIIKGDLETSCKTCQNYLLQKNFTNVLAKAYDNDFALTKYPSLIELELSNDCNLECTMCNGLLSSSIRKNREGLAPLASPYGDKFVQELREYIPHLREARFNGGEPFLIHIYYKIWDAILELNPSLRMVIATNGTVLNTRVKDYLSRGNFHINLSMDGFAKETYEKVRVNGKHDRLMQNFEYFHRYCKDNKRTLCIMINPMRQNWQEMPDFVNFCNKQDIHLWFNSIIHPEDQSLWNLPSDELKNIYTKLSEAHIHSNTSTSKDIYNYNLSTFHNLVHHQIKDWLTKAEKNKNAATYDANSSPAQRFWLKIKDHVNTKNANDTEAKLKQLQEKIDAIKAEFKDKWNEDEAYQSMLQADIHIVYTKLLTDDASTLAAMMREALAAKP